MPAAELYKFADAADGTKEMLKTVGDLSKEDIAGGRVLVWCYIRPRKVGNLIMPDSVVREDVWQSSVGYVLKTGPLAFKNDKEHDFGGFSVKAGDWVLFTPGEGKRVQINGADCRVIEDSLVQMKISDPNIITHRQ